MLVTITTLLYCHVINDPSGLTGDWQNSLAVTTQQPYSPYVKAQTIKLPLSLAFKKNFFLILIDHPNVVNMYLINP